MSHEQQTRSSILHPVRRLASLATRRRPQRPPGRAATTWLAHADLTIDPAGHRAYRGVRRLRLTPKEFLLLELFLRHPGRVLSRSEIYERVWGYDFGNGSNSLGVYVGYLRRKLEENGEPRLIHTVRGVGYTLSKRA
jgi:two-component system response regulator MprA